MHHCTITLHANQLIRNLNKKNSLCHHQLCTNQLLISARVSALSRRDRSARSGTQFWIGLSPLSVPSTTVRSSFVLLSVAAFSLEMNSSARRFGISSMLKKRLIFYSSLWAVIKHCVGNTETWRLCNPNSHNIIPAIPLGQLMGSNDSNNTSNIKYNKIRCICVFVCTRERVCVRVCACFMLEAVSEGSCNNDWISSKI